MDNAECKPMIQNMQELQGRQVLFFFSLLRFEMLAGNISNISNLSRLKINFLTFQISAGSQQAKKKQYLIFPVCEQVCHNARPLWKVVDRRSVTHNPDLPCL
jgi:hypothetical protein